MTHSTRLIRTPDQRLRVFVSSTLQELADERQAAQQAIERLRLAPVLFELGARPHPPQDLYRAYLDQSHIFIGLYWQKYGWIAPDMTISGLEDEYNLAGDRPKLIYLKSPAPDREPRLTGLLDRIRQDDRVSYKSFTTAQELRDLIENDLAMLLSESFETVTGDAPAVPETRPASQSRLPLPPTQLIGREAELAALRDLFLRPDIALITLTGPGGTGKSRLALQIARELADRFQDGVYFVALATVRDAQRVAPTVAQALGIREAREGQSLEATIRSFLRDKHVLLLLDNFEQVVDAASLVSDLIQMCPRLNILVTSRTPLRLRGEREFPVSPLALPTAKRSPSLEDLSQSTAVELFVQRARDVKPDFTLDPDNATAIAEICQRLDGLPLAIELAAARIKLLTPQTMVKRLEYRLPLLIGGARDLPQRQQTLRNTIEWSYNLLDERATKLFRRTAVFAGGWTLEAADVVCNLDGDLGDDVFDELVALVDNSLLKQVETSTGEVRFTMLETIREYATERLRECNELDRLRARHGEFCLQLSERAEPQLLGKQRPIWLATLEAEHDNLRAALAWYARDRRDAESALRLAAALGVFWFFAGYLSEGRNWLESTLALANATARTIAQARALSMAGALAWTQGDYPTARRWLEDGIALSREWGDAGRSTLARSLMFLGFVSVNQGDAAAAQALHLESLALSRAMGDRWLQAVTLSNLGDATLLSGDVVLARVRYEESLTIFEEFDDRWGRAVVLYALGSMGLYQRDYATARSAFAESTALCRILNDRWGIARGLLGSASVALYEDRALEAKALFRESLNLEQDIGNPAGAVMSLAGLASVAAAEGDSDRAALLAGAVDRLDDTVSARLWQPLRAVYGHHVAAARARARATESAWTTRYTEGQTLTLNEAIARAMAELP